jgi:hypothetical protein
MFIVRAIKVRGNYGDRIELGFENRECIEFELVVIFTVKKNLLPDKD